MFAGRPTVDVVILILTVTVCASLLLTGAGIIVLELRDPTTDTSAAASALGGIVTGITGALLGLIAGRRSNGTG